MPKEHAQELRELRDDDLDARLTEMQQDLFKQRFAQATGELNNPARLGQLRKEIARINTIIRERELKQLEGDN